jgi:predicted Fe-Mo cluster-binding NifX family protein
MENLAARSPCYLIFDRKGKLVVSIENPYREASSGAGALVADLLAKNGVRTFVAGNFGEKLRCSPDEKGVAYFKFTGQVKEAVSTFLIRNASKN